MTMPTLYEFHEVFLCNDVQRRKDQLTTINGPGCFAADQVYRKKYMPAVFPDEIIAIMDSGAYFTSWESSFGFPRPAILMVKDDKVRIMRKRESLDEMMQRDLMIKQSQIAGKATS